MGKIYTPRYEWDKEKRGSLDSFGEWVKRNSSAIQVMLNIKIIKDAERENKCPMYDGRNLCYLYPDGMACGSGGKLTDGKCLFYGETLEDLMETFRENIDKYTHEMG